MASTVFSSFGPLKPQHNMDERLDAAHALLGVSPNSVVEGNGAVTLFGGRALTKPALQAAPDDTVSSSSLDSSVEPVIVRRPRSNSAGLDALAFFATKEQASMESQKLTAPSVPLIVAPTNNGAGATLAARSVSSSCSSSSSDDDDSETMPPPPPRMRGRPRSFSNPEGMEKSAPRDRNRLHFVLPASILEEELAEASAAMKRKEGTFLLQLETQEESLHEEEDDEEEDESNLNQDELLRRARSRLLEDLSESSLTGEKGVPTLPHALTKYKEVRYLVAPYSDPLSYACILSLALTPLLARFPNRFTIRTAALESTLLRNELPLSIVSTEKDRVASGTRRSVTIVERI
jgi:hypothetical protein